MTCQSTTVPRRWALSIIILACPALLSAQVTTINVNDTVQQSTVRRFGINLGSQTFYDSGQMMKNLIFINPGFEGEIFQSTVRCGSGTVSSCMDENIYSGWPSNFWNGASFEFVYGSAKGRSGVISSYTAANYPFLGNFVFTGSGVSPNNGDYMIVRRTVSGNVMAGWWPTTTGAGTITANNTDLPPGTTGNQTAVLTAPTAADTARASSFFDSTNLKTFLQLNGQFQLSFKAKGISGTKSMAIGVNRFDAGLTYINQTVNLTDNWATYTYTFNASETGSAIGRVETFFATVGQDSFLLDDVSLVQLNTDPTNTTVFRDPVVNTLKAFNPGVLRFWFNQLGESLDNLISDQVGRQRSSYSPYHPTTNFISYSLTEFLQLCETIGAEPWIVVPMTFSDSESYSLIDYLAGPTNTPYGAKRAAQGHPATWLSSFAKIHLELGNEAWNSDFKGGAIEYPEAYGARAQGVFGAMRANASYAPSGFDLVLGGQSASLGRNQAIQVNCNNNDSFSLAPYMMYTVDAFSNNEDLYGTTFAEAEAFVSNRGTAEGVANGLILQNQLALQATSHPTPITTSEMNISPKAGSVPQSILDTFSTSVGTGVAVADSMLQQLRAGVLTQNLYLLPQDHFIRPDGKTVNLWGAVIDMGVTNRKRPQFLAVQMANNAIGNSNTMLATTNTGLNPTWEQFLLNSVQLSGAHHIQSFAFTGGGRYAIVIVNANRAFSYPVNFAGTHVPTGTVQMTQLSSANITDTNETSNVVVPVSSTLSNFNPSASLSLPPYSLTTLTWTTVNQPPALITGVTASGITATTATITWTTDQPASTQVFYGPTLNYNSQSPLVSTLVTSHSVTLTGLTPGTPYNYEPLSTNGSGVPSATSNFTFITPAAPLPSFSNVTATSITSTSATITWTTDLASSSRVNYGISPSLATQSALDSTLVTGHSVTLTGLTPGTNYSFAASSVTAAGGSNTSTTSTFSTLTVPLPVLSNVTATSITPTSAIITWNTDLLSSSRVNYGISPSLATQSALDSTLVQAHSVMLSGLTPGTMYSFAASSVTAAGGSNTSTPSTFSTLPAPGPMISNVAVTGITTTTATITWTTDVLSSSLVNYGTSLPYTLASALNSTPLTTHSVTLTGLTPSTTYNYSAFSAISSGASSSSPNATFSTAALPGPVISNVAVTGITTTSATVTWTTDVLSSSLVNYGTSLPYTLASALNSTPLMNHSVTLNGLTPGTTYNYSAFSAISSGASGSSTNATFATQSAAGPVITNVQVTNITTTAATVTWTTDVLSSSLVNYGTSLPYTLASALNSTPLTTHSVTLTGLTPGTTYNYSVFSAISSGASNSSANATFVTPFGTPVISAVTATSITSSSVIVTWTTDQPTSSLVNYGTSLPYTLASALNSTLVTSHSVMLTGLTPTTTYNFSVVSANSASLSNSSPNATFATVAAPGPVLSLVTATGITSTSATITWTTDIGSTSLVNYGTSLPYSLASPLNTTLVMLHSVTLSGLTPATTYNYQAFSANSAGTSNTSVNLTFTTPAGTPVISAVAASGITATAATITWTTDQLTSSQVNYGTTLPYSSSTTLNNTLVTSHSLTLTGLTPSTTYNYQVFSANSAATPATSLNFTFTTTSQSGTPPVISNLATFPVSNTTASILWVTDQNATSLVKYGTTAAYGLQSTPDNTLGLYHVVPLTGLTQGTTYHFSVITANGAGTTATSADFTFTTTGNAPMVFSAVTASGITSTTAVISWTTDKFSTSQVAFGTTGAYGSLSGLDTSPVTSHSVALTGLAPGTAYNFAALSTTATIPSAASGNFTFVTAASTGGTAPAISSVNVTGITPTTATITWNTNQASSSRVAYGTSSLLSTLTPLDTTLVTAHSVTLTGLTQSTTYSYAVTSANSSSLSTTSPTFTFATTSATGPAPVMTNLATYPVTDTSASILWTTDVNATSLVNYGSTSAYGLQSAPSSALGLYHAVPLTGLTPGTTYHFSAVTANALGATTTSADFTFTTTGTAPIVFSAVTATNITSTSAIITWTTDKFSTSQVNYGTTAAYGSQSTQNPALLTAHSVTLTGLTPGTLYNFAALSTNATIPSAASSNFTFTTAPGSGGGTAPVISNVTATGISATSATITWTTDQLSTSRVSYGPTPAMGLQSTLDGTLVTSHSVTLIGLTGGTTYTFAVSSVNTGGLSTTSPTSTFTTSTVTVPGPVISNLATYPVADNSASILWTTDQNATSLVKYGTTSAYGLQVVPNNSLGLYHVVPLTGLSAGTTYHFMVSTTNSSGVTTTSADSTFTTTGAAPMTFSAVTATSITSTSAIITWTTDKASTSQVNYGTTAAYGAQSALDPSLVTSHSVTLIGLTPSTAYNFAALSTNASVPSAASANFTFTTAAGSGGGTPPAISNVSSTGVTSTSATITWATDQVATSRVSYGISPSLGTLSALDSTLVTGHSVTLTGLTPGTTYSYAATSANASSQSTTSTPLTFTTTSAVAGPNIVGVASWGVTGSGATISWSTEQLSDTAVEFGTTTALGQTSTVQSAMSASHGVVLTGLAGNTTYYFRARSTNAGGGIGYSVIYSFTTLDVSAPVISNVLATPGVGNSAVVSWTVSKPATTQVEYGTTQSYGFWSPQTTGLQTALGWVPSGTIHFRIHSSDAAGNQSVSIDYTFVEP